MYLQKYKLRGYFFTGLSILFAFFYFPAQSFADNSYSYLRFGLGYEWSGVNNQLGSKLSTINKTPESNITIEALPQNCFDGEGVTHVGGIDVRRAKSRDSINLIIQKVALELANHMRVRCGENEFKPTVYFEASKNLKNWVVVDDPSDELLMKFYYRFATKYMERMNTSGKTEIYRVERKSKGAIQAYYDKSRQYTALIKNGQIYLAFDAANAAQKDWFIGYVKSKGYEAHEVKGDEVSLFRIAIVWNRFDKSNFLAQYFDLHSDALDFYGNMYTKYVVNKHYK